MKSLKVVSRHHWKHPLHQGDVLKLVFITVAVIGGGGGGVVALIAAAVAVVLIASSVHSFFFFCFALSSLS